MNGNTSPEQISIERRAKKHVKSQTHRWFAVCSPGTEPLLRSELAGLGIEAIPGDIPGGVEFDGRLETGMLANLGLRTATRVLVRVKSFRARAVEDVFRETVAVPWEAWLPARCVLEIQPTIHESRIESRTLLGSTIVDAVRRRFELEGLRAPTIGRESATQTLTARLTADHLELSLDSSGELLHRRGWRRQSVAAPIRENLAAAILFAAGFAPGMNLVDAMCGSGTLAIEAALMATGTPPGLSARPPRDFAFMEWPAFSRPTWEHMVKNAAGSPSESIIVARDISPGAIAAARANAVNAGVADIIRVEQADFFESTPPVHCGAPPDGTAPAAQPCPSGLIVLNPPYGMRLDINGTPVGMYNRIARALSTNWPGWRYAIIIPDASQARLWPLRPETTLQFLHGGLHAVALIGLNK